MNYKEPLGLVLDIISGTRVVVGNRNMDHADDESISTLLSMGFQDMEAIKRSLQMSKNDVNEAVIILTSSSSSDSPRERDVDMKDISWGGGSERWEDREYEGGFPVRSLKELESRVFQDNWSIPYKKDESLGKCLRACRGGSSSSPSSSPPSPQDEAHINKFLERVLPEAFNKLLTSSATRRWEPEVQSGIYDMLKLFLEVLSPRLKAMTHKDVEPPASLLDILTTAFDLKNDWNHKNRDEEISLDSSYVKPFVLRDQRRIPFGWMRELLHSFGNNEGFECLMNYFARPPSNLNARSMSSLLSPLSVCCALIQDNIAEIYLKGAVEASLTYVKEISDLRSKNITAVSDLIGSVKLLCRQFWPDKVESCDSLRLSTVIRMLKTPFFNSRMNALKEVSRLIEESKDGKKIELRIEAFTLSEWMSQNRVLSVALEGNIDQVQYTDRIHSIVEFLGPELSTEEISRMWALQKTSSMVMENVYSILAGATNKFSLTQFEHLISLIESKWEEGFNDDRLREKFLAFIGQIGKDAKQLKCTSTILQLLWNVSHLESLPKHLVERSMSEHLSILDEMSHHKEATRRSYILQCVDDIKTHSHSLLPSIKQLHEICQFYSRGGTYHHHKTDKSTLVELNRQHNIVKLLSNSLKHSHSLATKNCIPLRPDSLVDKRYTHNEYVAGHLNLLMFLLKEGDLYLSWEISCELWSTLIENSGAIQSDKDQFFTWIQECLPDLEMETQRNFFLQKLLSMNPVEVDEFSFNCFKAFFQSINAYDNLLSKKASYFALIVEDLELVGLDYFWQLVMECEREVIADLAIDYLLELTYHNVTQRLKKDPVNLHKRFIHKCYDILENIFFPPLEKQDAVFEGCEVETSVRNEGETVDREGLNNSTLTATSVSKVSSPPLHTRGLKLQKIRRLIHLAERYISTIEETINIARSILPHASSFYGRRIRIKALHEITKEEFEFYSHTNEPVGSIKHRIANVFKKSIDYFTISVGDVSLVPSKDRCFIGMINAIIPLEEVNENSEVITWILKPGIKDNKFVGPEEYETIVEDEKDLGIEKTLPGVVMSSGGRIFSMLYKIATLRVVDSDRRMMNGLMRLIHLIPTDPEISNIIDSLVVGDSAAAASPKLSSKKSVSYAQELSDLFDATADGMSPFRVLYNLEILSGKLMPTKSGRGAQSRLFAKDFIKSDGFKLIVKALDSLPPDVDYEIRQSAYSVALQLCAFLLCGQNVIPSDSSLGMIPTPPKKSAFEFNKNLCPPHTSTVPTSANNLLRSMSLSGFKDTISRLMKVIWAASAGKLHMAASSLTTINRSTISENSYFSDKRQSRNSSTGSSSSEDNISSSSSNSGSGGISTPSKQVGIIDAQIAGDAFELLITCLSLRTHDVSQFYDLPLVDEFIVDTVLGSSSRIVRRKAREQLIRFSNIPYVRRNIFPTDSSTSTKTTGIPTPRQFLTQVILKTPVPLWMPSCKARGTSHVILSQCSEYFDIRCSVLKNLSCDEQKTLLSESASQMLDNELLFLYNYTPCSPTADCDLLAGHLKLAEALITCEGVDKARVGEGIIKEVQASFLFPASRIIAEESDIRSMNPKCDTSESRIAAYNLLIELSRDCPVNMKIISDELITLHHQYYHHREDIGKGFDYEPDVERRKDFVGLKNAGATCYMNSVLQQLYSVPGIATSILGENEKEEERNGESIFYQLQVVFGYLLQSKLKYFNPESFLKCLKLFGEPVNVREQRDAFEFFTQIVSQVDDYLASKNRPKIFATKFEGIFSDQKICQGCPHRYEREQTFTALNLPIMTNSLVESLNQFVKGELLEGDNAYYCEKCGTKRNAIKRMCIRTCPSTLVIQLKRFHYDWETNRALKFDDFFEFPMSLDMGPYTSEGIRQKMREESSNKKKQVDAKVSYPYDLSGIVVHSGQANAGHYYSLIRKRKSDGKGEPFKWYKFNDVTVEEFDMNDETIVSECFGGNYTVKKLPSSNLPEERTRYWNAYMLFYEARKPSKKHGKKKSSSFKTTVRFSSLSASPSLGNPPLSAPPLTRESFSHLTDLLEKGERTGLFDQRHQIPNSIEKSIREHNLKFLRNRDLFCPEYFRFVTTLVKLDSSKVDSLKLSVHFLFNGYIHLRARDLNVVTDMIKVIECSSDSESNVWLLKFLSENQQMFRLIMLECPCHEIRTHFTDLIYRVLSSNDGCDKYRKDILSTCACLLDQDAPNHSKDSKLLFWLIWKYSRLGVEQCKNLLDQNVFRFMVKFLLGIDPNDPVTYIKQRRWTCSQTREFSELHSAITTVISHCDHKPYWDCEHDNDSNPIKEKIKAPKSVESILYRDLAPMYIREIITAMREIAGYAKDVQKMVIELSFYCEKFSFLILEELLRQYNNVNSSELRHLSTLLIDILHMEDPLQLKRIKFVLEGNSISRGLLNLIPIHKESDSRRAYQCIKTLVNAANKTPPLKDYLLLQETACKWEEAVDWLQNKMVDLSGNDTSPSSTVIPYAAPCTSSSVLSYSSSISTSDLFSNEDSSTRTFRRTTSAQVTLDEANALMAQYGPSNMEIEEELMKTDE